jgi:hypothetical protein
VSSVQLLPLLLQLERQPGSLREQVEAAVGAHGTPLRWAITAVEHRPEQPPLLQIEAVVLSDGAAEVVDA